MNSAKLTVNGKDLSGYTIAAELSRAYYSEAAEAIKAATRSTLDIVDISEATESSIVLKHIEKVSGEDSFRVYVSGTQLVIECAYDNMLLRAVDELLSSASGDLTGEVFKKDISVVYYEDFGAVGDGKADDFKAIYETHKFANECGQTVKAKPDKTYYIFDTRMGTDTVYSAEIRTNVDWCGAHFIIDDTQIATLQGSENYRMSRGNIFEVLPEEEHRMFKIADEQKLARIAEAGVNPKTTHIDLGIDWNGRVLIIPYYSGHKVFRRKGYSQYAGAPTHEIIVLEADGRVSEETPIIFDYMGLDYIEVYKLDPAGAITIENGSFTTLDTKINHRIDGVYKGGYILRGIDVQRSYTTVQNLTHAVIGEFTLADRVKGLEGSITKGFFTANYTSNVIFKNCIMPSRMSYNNSSTYNFNATHVNKIVLDHCIQPNFWITVDPVTYEIKYATEYDPSVIGNARRASDDALIGMTPYTIDGVNYTPYYGFCGTNYCKNMEYLNSTLSRFDAHAALYNGKVINCNITDMELTGYGSFVLENSNFYPYRPTTPFLFLRADYGYTWEGDIIIRNVNAYPRANAQFEIVRNKYINWYFGYTCAFPNIKVDNLDLYSMETGDPLPKGYPVYVCKFTENDKYKHLLDTDLPAVFGVVDEDGDGYIDEPLYDRNRDGRADKKDRVDLDGDGRVGNTSLKFEDYFEKDGLKYRAGVSHPTCKANLNITKPPQYIKIINNDGVNGGGGYSYLVKDTSGEGVSDGKWWNDEDSLGGFFGDTKFIYGEGDADFLIGTDKNQTATETFVFKGEYD